MPWNQVKSGETTIYADTRRNNIYVLKVTAFEKVGMNYDPNDEEDPNIPKPNNPDEPTTPPDGGDPSWDKAETFAAFFTQLSPGTLLIATLPSLSTDLLIEIFPTKSGA